MNFVIRKMVKNDIKNVQDVATKSWNATYEGIIPIEVQENFLQQAYSDEMMEKRLNSSLLLVAEVGDTIVGFANFSPVSKEGKAELSAIYLYPQHQGKGIGTALLQEGIKNLHGIKEVYIDVEKENNVGKNFYHAKGFHIVKEFDDNFDGHLLKTIRMKLKLAF